MPPLVPVAQRSSSLPSQRFSPALILPVLLTGLIAATVVITFSISFSGLVFPGPLAAHASAGVGLALLGTVILSVVIPCFSTYPGTIGGIISLPAIALGVIATSLASTVSSDQLLPTIFVSIMAAGLFTGLAMYLFGVFDLGKIGQYVPYPVIGGFIAGLGIILVKNSLSFGLSADFSLARIASLDAGGIRFLLSNRDLLLISLVALVGIWIWTAEMAGSSKYNIPLILAAVTSGFWVITWYFGITPGELREGGWLLGPFPEGRFWTPAQNFAALANADWFALFWEIPKIPVVLLLVLIPALMDASSLELAVKQDIDPNREIKVAGAGNILCGLAGGFLGAASFSATTMVARARVPYRIVGLVSATCCSLVFFFGAETISYLPKFPIAGLLFYIGIDFMREWLYSSYGKVSKVDYATILAVFFVVIVFGFMEGFFVGLVLGFIFFVLTYSSLPVVRYATTGAYQFSNVEHPEQDRNYLKSVGERTVIFKLQGFIFFGTARRLLDRVRAKMTAAELPPLDYLVLDFNLVDGLDSSAMVNFQKIVQYAETGGFLLVLSHCSPELTTRFAKHGIRNADSQHVELFPDMDRSLEWVEQRQIAVRDAKGPTGGGSGSSLKDLFSSAAIYDALLSYCETCTFSSGDFLVRQGEEANDIFLVQEGEVSVYLEVADGNRIRLRKYLAGTVVGEVAILLGIRRTASVIAGTNMTAYRLSRTAMARMKTERPEIVVEFEEALLKMTAARLQDGNRLLRELAD